MSYSEPAVLDRGQPEPLSAIPVRSVPGNGELNIGELSESIGYHMRRAQMRIYNGLTKALDPFKVTPAQFGLLVKIHYNAGISQTALAKANDIERSTLGEIVDRFEKRQLVERRKHATDRRAYALHLSAEGEELLRQTIPIVVAHEKRVFDNWSPEDRDALRNLLIKASE